MCVVEKVTNGETLVKSNPGVKADTRVNADTESGHQNLALMIGRIFKPAGLLST